MKKNLFATLGALFLITIFFAPSVYALGFGARAEYWIPTFKGDLRKDYNGNTGTEINMEDDLGIGIDNIPGVDAFFSTGNHAFRFSYLQINLSGAQNIGKEIIFNGDTYNINAYVESEYKTNMFDFEYQYKFLNLENILAGFSLGIIGKVKYLNGEVKVSSTTIGSTHNNQEDINLPIPMIGLGLNIGLLANILEARAKFAGMAYSGSFCYEGSADISLTPFPFLDIYGGYRMMSIKVDDFNDLYTQMDFSGPYAGLAVSF